MLPFEYGIHDVRIVNDLCRAADAVLVLGAKFGHNGTAGFRLQLPADRLLHIDASDEVLGANYPARVTARADVSAPFLSCWRDSAFALSASADKSIRSRARGRMRS